MRFTTLTKEIKRHGAKLNHYGIVMGYFRNHLITSKTLFLI